MKNYNLTEIYFHDSKKGHRLFLVLDGYMIYYKIFKKIFSIQFSFHLVMFVSVLF